MSPSTYARNAPIIKWLRSNASAGSANEYSPPVISKAKIESPPGKKMCGLGEEKNNQTVKSRCSLVIHNMWMTR